MSRIDRILKNVGYIFIGWYGLGMSVFVLADMKQKYLHSKNPKCAHGKLKTTTDCFICTANKTRDDKTGYWGDTPSDF